MSGMQKAKGELTPWIKPALNGMGKPLEDGDVFAHASMKDFRGETLGPWQRKIRDAPATPGWMVRSATRWMNADEHPGHPVPAPVVEH